MPGNGRRRVLRGQPHLVGAGLQILTVGLDGARDAHGTERGFGRRNLTLLCGGDARECGQQECDEPSDLHAISSAAYYARSVPFHRLASRLVLSWQWGNRACYFFVMTTDPLWLRTDRKALASP